MSSIFLAKIKGFKRHSLQPILGHQAVVSKIRSTSISDRILDWNAEIRTITPNINTPPIWSSRINRSNTFDEGFLVGTDHIWARDYSTPFETWTYNYSNYIWSVTSRNINEYLMNSKKLCLFLSTWFKNIARITQTEDYSVTVYVNGWPTNIALFPHDKIAD